MSQYLKKKKVEIVFFGVQFILLKSLLSKHCLIPLSHCANYHFNILFKIFWLKNPGGHFFLLLFSLFSSSPSLINDSWMPRLQLILLPRHFGSVRQRTPLFSNKGSLWWKEGQEKGQRKKLLSTETNYTKIFTNTFAL